MYHSGKPKFKNLLLQLYRLISRFSLFYKLPQKYENFLSACQIQQLSRFCIAPALKFVLLSRKTKKSISIMKDTLELQKVKCHGLTFYEKAAEKEDEAYSVAKQLVENLFFDMSKLSTKYWNDTFCALPFTYSERRLDSILLPVLSKLCNSMVLVELPTTRYCSNRKFTVDEANGRIDYWCIYKDYSFIIELKHSYDCFTTMKTRESKVSSRWLKMNEQLESVKDIAKQYGEKTKGVIRLGLHIITSYSDKYPEKGLIKQFEDSIPNTIERFFKDVSKRYPSLRPDMIMCWKIPNRIALSEYQNQTFPGLWALAKIYSPIRHQGAVK